MDITVKCSMRFHLTCMPKLSFAAASGITLARIANPDLSKATAVLSYAFFDPLQQLLLSEKYLLQVRSSCPFTLQKILQNMGINIPFVVIFVSVFAVSLLVQIFSFKAHPNHGNQPQCELPSLFLPTISPGSARPTLVLGLLPAPVRLQNSPWKLS